MPWMVRLRAHDGGEILERASFGSPTAAMDAYRQMLAREDLVGQPVSAVFKPPAGVAGGGTNVSSFFSRFDCEVGEGRIAHDDPRLDPFADSGTARHVATSLPPQQSHPIDWEADDRPFSDVLKAWARRRGGRDAAAEALRVSRKTLDGWCDGRGAAQEGMARRLMTLIDRGA